MIKNSKIMKKSREKRKQTFLEETQACLTFDIILQIFLVVKRCSRRGNMAARSWNNTKFKTKIATR